MVAFSNPCCLFYEPAWPTFSQDLGELLLYVAPGVICALLWKIFVTNRTQPRGNILGLGLDDSSSVYSALPEPAISGWTVLLYVLTIVLTFGLGVLAFDVVQALS